MEGEEELVKSGKRSSKNYIVSNRFNFFVCVSKFGIRDAIKILIDELKFHFLF